MPVNTYSPSVNIIRDADRALVYHTTPNALRVVDQIADDFKKGVRAFNVVGAYGTGKSSLLWAMEQSLRATAEKSQSWPGLDWPGRKRFFDLNLVPNPAAKVVNFIGEYASIIDTFADHFGAASSQAQPILHEVFNQYHELGVNKTAEQNPLLVLVIDEFGKFLEYAVQHEPEKNAEGDGCAACFI